MKMNTIDKIITRILKWCVHIDDQDIMQGNIFYLLGVSIRFLGVFIIVGILYIVKFIIKLGWVPLSVGFLAFFVMTYIIIPFLHGFVRYFTG